MTRAQLLLALCSITGTAASLSASDCDCAKVGKHSTCSCTHDDSGLLDVVDHVAGRIHAEVRKNVLQLTRLPGAGQSVQGSGKARSGGCDCYACQTGSMSLHTAPHSDHSQAHHSLSNAPQSGATQGTTPKFRVPTPVPDSQVNPFVDEPPPAGQNKVRGKTIQYRQDSRSSYPGVNQPGANQPGASPTAVPRARYGQQYSPQAQRPQSTADYWAEDNQLHRPLQLVAPASSESPTLEQVFKPAYRLNLRDDAEEQATQVTPTRQPSQLRPVPNSSTPQLDLPSRTSTNNEQVQRYEREIKPMPVYDNPLRR